MAWTVAGAHATDGTTQIDVQDDGDVHITIGTDGWIIVPIETLEAVLAARRLGASIRTGDEWDDAVRDAEVDAALDSKLRSRARDEADRD